MGASAAPRLAAAFMTLRTAAREHIRGARGRVPGRATRPWCLTRSTLEASSPAPSFTLRRFYLLLADGTPK